MRIIIALLNVKSITPINMRILNKKVIVISSIHGMSFGKKKNITH
jgi:hypothetical protein